MHTVRPLIHKAIQIELTQICRLATLASMAPDELTRGIILEMIQEETAEAIFWNTVDAAYQVMPIPGVGPCPTMAPYPTLEPYPTVPPYPYPTGAPCPDPSILPPLGPEATLPPTMPSGPAADGSIPGLPGFFSEPEKKEEK